MKNKEIKKAYLKMEVYTKGNQNNWYCDYYYFNGEESTQGTTRATGFGYDKQSTALSNAINKFKNKYQRYNKKAKKYTRYGLYEDNTISYGIGANAVIKCIDCFKNVKIIDYIETYRNTIILNIEILEDKKEMQKNA